MITPEDERTLNNPEYVKDLHRVTGPLRKKVMAQQLNKGKNYPKDRLLNIIFDVVGDPEKMRNIIDTVKEYGYKVGIVWVLTSVERADIQNKKRSEGGKDRNIERDILINGHKEAIKAMEYVLNSDLIYKVDEIFVVDNLNSVQIRKDDSGKNLPEDEYKYIKNTNVYHIPTNRNGFEEFQNILDIIANNIHYLYK